MGESMSKAEAVYELMAMARGGGYIATASGSAASRNAVALQAVVQFGGKFGSAAFAA
jgi:hypothetical protein